MKGTSQNKIMKKRRNHGKKIKPFKGIVGPNLQVTKKNPNNRKSKSGLTEIEKITVILAFTFLK